jgi:hypothetical protein
MLSIRAFCMVTGAQRYGVSVVWLALHPRVALTGPPEPDVRGLYWPKAALRPRGTWEAPQERQEPVVPNPGLSLAPITLRYDGLWACFPGCFPVGR